MIKKNELSAPQRHLFKHGRRIRVSKRETAVFTRYTECNTHAWIITQGGTGGLKTVPLELLSRWN